LRNRFQLTSTLFVVVILRNTSSYNKALKETVRHIWLLDLKTHNKIDLTEDSPTQHSAPSWCPDGTKISFAKGIWDVYLRDMTGPNRIIKVGPGYYSEWLDEKTIAVGNFESVTLYNLETMDKKSKLRFNPASIPLNSV